MLSVAMKIVSSPAIVPTISGQCALSIAMATLCAAPVVVRSTVSVGPAIDPTGLTANEVLSRAEAWIETEMARISPHLYGGAA